MNMLDRIPEELKRLEQWVVVSTGSKIPRNAWTGDPASSSDPATWSTFEACANRVIDGKSSNVGFVFHNNGYVGIDIDAGYDPDGLLTPLAADILSVCASYTERSRSGRGFHVIVRGDLPFKGRNGSNGVEIYKDARYFITTGDVLLYDSIIENQQAIDYVLDKYFPDMLRASEERTSAMRVYNPMWQLPVKGRVKLRPVYPRIPAGCRNICLTSLAGMMHNHGYNADQIYDELQYANAAACDPCLDDWEVLSIVRSVTRYKR